MCQNAVREPWEPSRAVRRKSNPAKALTARAAYFGGRNCVVGGTQRAAQGELRG